MKKYNPFKMWGSYVGAIIGLGISILGGLEYFNFYFTPLMSIFNNMAVVNFIITPGHIIVGFLAGWGIHSLARRLN